MALERQNPESLGQKAPETEGKTKKLSPSEQRIAFLEKIKDFKRQIDSASDNVITPNIKAQYRESIQFFLQQAIGKDNFEALTANLNDRIKEFSRKAGLDKKLENKKTTIGEQLIKQLKIQGKAAEEIAANLNRLSQAQIDAFNKAMLQLNNGKNGNDISKTLDALPANIKKIIDSIYEALSIQGQKLYKENLLFKISQKFPILQNIDLINRLKQKDVYYVESFCEQFTAVSEIRDSFKKYKAGFVSSGVDSAWKLFTGKDTTDYGAVGQGYEKLIKGEILPENEFENIKSRLRKTDKWRNAAKTGEDIAVRMLPTNMILDGISVNTLKADAINTLALSAMVLSGGLSTGLVLGARGTQIARVAITADGLITGYYAMQGGTEIYHRLKAGENVSDMKMLIATTLMGALGAASSAKSLRQLNNMGKKAKQASEVHKPKEGPNLMQNKIELTYKKLDDLEKKLNEVPLNDDLLKESDHIRSQLTDLNKEISQLKSSGAHPEKIKILSDKKERVEKLLDDKLVSLTNLKLTNRVIETGKRINECNSTLNKIDSDELINRLKIINDQLADLKKTCSEITDDKVRKQFEESIKTLEDSSKTIEEALKFKLRSWERLSEIATNSLDNPRMIQGKSGRMVYGEDAGFEYKEGVTGKVKREDRVVADTDRDAFASIDGMGGMGDGDKAAQILAEEFQKGIKNIKPGASEQEIKKVFEQIQTNAHSRMLKELPRDKITGLPSQGGACYIGAKIENGVLHIAQSGDVKLMVIRKDKVIFQTQDEGTGHIVNNSVQAVNRGKTTFSSFKLEAGDRIVAGSDGLWDNFVKPGENTTVQAAERVADAINGRSIEEGMSNIEQITRERMSNWSKPDPEGMVRKPDNRNVIIYDYEGSQIPANNTINYQTPNQPGQRLAS